MNRTPIKAGDLCFVVHPALDMVIDKVVRVLAPWGAVPRAIGNVLVLNSAGMQAWEVRFDRPVDTVAGPLRDVPMFASWLRPIRDTDGEDEVTRISRLKDEEDARREKADVMAPRRQVEFSR